MSAAEFENINNQLNFENEYNQCNQLDFIYKDFPYIALGIKNHDTLAEEMFGMT